MAEELLIEKFIRQFGVNMNEAVSRTTNATAALINFYARVTEGVRPICDDDVCCPADGQVSQVGNH